MWAYFLGKLNNQKGLPLEIIRYEICREFRATDKDPNFAKSAFYNIILVIIELIEKLWEYAWAKVAMEAYYIIVSLNGYTLH